MKVKEESEKVGLKLNIQKIKNVASSPITSWQIDGETMKTVTDFILGGSKITADGDCCHEIKRRLLLGRKVNDQPRQHIKKQTHYFTNRGPSSQSYGFSSSHVWMWELDYKESWALKNWCFWAVVLKKTLGYSHFGRWEMVSDFPNEYFVSFPNICWPFMYFLWQNVCARCSLICWVVLCFWIVRGLYIHTYIHIYICVYIYIFWLLTHM